MYEVPPPVRCLACTQIAIRQEAKSSGTADGTASQGYSQPTAMHFHAERKVVTRARS